MFTLKFETDARAPSANDPHLSTVIEASRYRVRRQPAGSIDVLVENENGVEIAYPISDELGSHSRCYVMNDAGNTIQTIRPSMTRGKMPEPSNA